MSKASAVALTLPKPGAPVSTWADDGYECSYYRSANGVGWVTVTGPGMGQPWHEVCDSEGKARSLAKAAIPRLRAGKSPRNGVFKMLAKGVRLRKAKGKRYWDGDGEPPAGQGWQRGKRGGWFKATSASTTAPVPEKKETRPKKPTKAQRERDAKRIEQMIADHAVRDRHILHHRAAMDHHEKHPDVPGHVSAHAAHMEAQAAIGRPDYRQKREAADDASAAADGTYGESEDKFWEEGDHTNQAQSHRRDANGLERLAHAVDHIHHRAGGTGEHKTATELRGLAARHRRAEMAHDVASRHIGLDKSGTVGEDLDTPEQRHAHSMTTDAHPRNKREEGFLKGKGIPEAALALSRSWPATEHSPRLHKSATWTHQDHADVRDDHRSTAKGLERMASAAELGSSPHHVPHLLHLADRHHDAADAHHAAVGALETRAGFPKGYHKAPAPEVQRAHAASAAAEPQTAREHRYVGRLRKAVLAKARRAPDGTPSKDGRKIKQNGKWVPNPNRAARKRTQEPAELDPQHLKPFVGDEHADPERDTHRFDGQRRRDLLDAHNHHVAHMDRLAGMIEHLEQQGRYQEARGLRFVHGAHEHARFSFHAAVQEHARGNHAVAQKHARNGWRAAREVQAFGTPVMKGRRLLVKGAKPKNPDGVVKFIGQSKRTKKYPAAPPAMPGSFGGDVSYLHHRRAEHADLESWAWRRARRTRDPYKRKLLQYHASRHMVAGQHLEHALQAHDGRHPETAAFIRRARTSSDEAYAAGTHHMRDRTLGGRIRKVGKWARILKAKKRARGVPYQEGGAWWIIDEGAKRRRPYKPPGEAAAAAAPDLRGGPSKGSLGVHGQWEYMVGSDGSLYRAPTHNPIDTEGYRQGARFECSPRRDGFEGYLAAQGVTLTKPPKPKRTRKPKADLGARMADAGEEARPVGHITPPARHSEDRGDGHARLDMATRAANRGDADRLAEGLWEGIVEMGGAMRYAPEPGKRPAWAPAPTGHDGPPRAEVLYGPWVQQLRDRLRELGGDEWPLHFAGEHEVSEAGRTLKDLRGTTDPRRKQGLLSALGPQSRAWVEARLADAAAEPAGGARAVTNAADIVARFRAAPTTEAGKRAVHAELERLDPPASVWKAVARGLKGATYANKRKAKEAIHEWVTQFGGWEASAAAVKRAYAETAS